MELDLVMAILAVCPMFGTAAFQEVINAAMAPHTHFLFQGCNFQVGKNGDTIFIGENRDTIFIARLGRNRRSTPDKIKDQAERHEDRYYVSFEIHYYFDPRQMYFSKRPATIRAWRHFASIRTTCGTHVVSVKRSVAILIYIFAGAYGR